MSMAPHGVRTDRIMRGTQVAVTPIPRRLSDVDHCGSVVTRQEADEAAAASYERGHADGHVAGTELGRAEARAETDRVVNAIRAAASEATSAVQAALRAHADEVVQLALAAAEAVIGREPHDGGHALSERVHRALDALDDAPLTVRANVDDVGCLGAALEHDLQLTVVADTTLLPGEARIEGRWASVDLTRQAAWDAIAEVIDDLAG